MARVCAGKTPSQAALIDADRVVTYAQRNERSNRVANAPARSGMRTGFHVGFLGKNSAAFFEIWVGVNKAGGVITPLNWRGAPAELVDVVHDANIAPL
jgi:long-chain acyl-CoA synthetase